jgi:CRP-like cAMP-binding protein
MANFNRFVQSKRFFTFEAGQVIFERGDASDFMYGIVTGDVDIRLGDRLLETISAGSVFGEMALIDDEPRSATAVAKTECRVVQVDAPGFHELIILHPEFALEVMKLMTHRLRRQIDAKYVGE